MFLLVWLSSLLKMLLRFPFVHSWENAKFSDLRMFHFAWILHFLYICIHQLSFLYLKKRRIMYTELRDNLYSKKKYLQITYVAKDLLSRIHKPLRKFNFKIKLCGLKNVEMDSINTFFLQRWTYRHWTYTSPQHYQWFGDTHSGHLLSQLIKAWPIEQAQKYRFKCRMWKNLDKGKRGVNMENWNFP